VPASAPALGFEKEDEAELDGASSQRDGRFRRPFETAFCLEKDAVRRRIVSRTTLATEGSEGPFPDEDKASESSPE
jgi:hypothetical protein